MCQKRTKTDFINFWFAFIVPMFVTIETKLSSIIVFTNKIINFAALCHIPNL